MVRKPFSLGEDSDTRNPSQMDEGKTRECYNYDKDNSAKAKRRNSQKQEDRWAKLVGGNTQVASGAFWHSKGDVKEKVVEILSNFCWENKYTSKGKFRIKKKTWLGIKEKAYTQGNIPGMHIELQHPKFDDFIRLVVISKQEFDGLVKNTTEYEIETKETSYKSFRIEGDKWRRFEKETYGKNKAPIMEIKLIEHDITWILLSEEEFLQLR